MNITRCSKKTLHFKILYYYYYTNISQQDEQDVQQLQTFLNLRCIVH